MQQLPLTPGQIAQAIELQLEAMADTTCLHCWLRQFFWEKDIDPDFLPSLWPAISRTNPTIGYSLLRLMQKDTTYVEEENCKSIAGLLKFNNEQRQKFNNLNYRNKLLFKQTRSKVEALSFCLRD